MDTQKVWADEHSMQKMSTQERAWPVKPWREGRVAREQEMRSELWESLPRGILQASVRTGLQIGREGAVGFAKLLSHFLKITYTFYHNLIT